MKKFLSMLLVFLGVMMSGCGDDEKSPEIELLPVMNSAPENINFTFSSPDLHCGISREGRIYANQYSGELTIKSPNANSLTLKETTDGRDNFYQSEEGYWSVTLVDGNTLEFKFEPLPEPDSDSDASRTDVFYPHYYREYYLPVRGAVDGQALVTIIILTRFYR